MLRSYLTSDHDEDSLDKRAARREFLGDYYSTEDMVHCMADAVGAAMLDSATFRSAYGPGYFPRPESGDSIQEVSKMNKHPLRGGHRIISEGSNMNDAVKKKIDLYLECKNICLRSLP